MPSFLGYGPSLFTYPRDARPIRVPPTALRRANSPVTALSKIRLHYYKHPETIVSTFAAPISTITVGLGTMAIIYITFATLRAQLAAADLRLGDGFAGVSNDVQAIDGRLDKLEDLSSTILEKICEMKRKGKTA